MTGIAAIADGAAERLWCLVEIAAGAAAGAVVAAGAMRFAI